MVDIGDKMNWKETTFWSSGDRSLILMKVEVPILELYLCQVDIVNNLSVCH